MNIEINKVYNEDCVGEKGMCLIPDKSIDMILCDLPYGTTACKWDSAIPNDLLWQQYKRICKDDAAIVLTATNPFAATLIQSNIAWFKYEWVWHKNMTSGFALAKKQPLRNHELVLVFYKKQPTYNPIKEPRDLSESSKQRMNYDFTTTKGTNEHQNGIKKVRFIPEDKELSYPKTVKKWNGVNSHNRFHATEKPLDMMEYLIKTYTNEGDTVLDNCMGSGTTAIACINTNRNYIGFEKEEKYFNIIQERIKNHNRPSVFNEPILVEGQPSLFDDLIK